MNIKSPLDCQIPFLRQLWKDAFGDEDAFLDHFFTTAFAPERCRILSEGDTIVAALYWFDCQHDEMPIAYLYAISTASHKRGQGYCHMLMNDTHAFLAQTGYKGALLVPASPKLFDFYKDMGYETTCYIKEMTCPAKEAAIDLHPVTKEEYASLRRNYLPKGGVIQEKENLDFLQIEASFYAGEDYLLAARKEGDYLRGLELLGNPDIAPAIVHRLGFKKGTFRLPGNDIPFAMYLPLTQAPLSKPAYFGLPFD